MCCLNYKRKEVEGHELKLHRLAADKKVRKVRWSLFSETGQKSDSMLYHYNPHCFILFYLLYFGQNSFSILMLLKIGMGCIFKKDSQQNHQAYVLSLLSLCYNETCGLILALNLSAV